MRNISMFIFNFNYIKDLARITMDEKCNGIYCEAETDRYQIAKNSYNLLMPNDVFNSKTYTIFVFIISIMIFIYYYRMLKLYDYTVESVEYDYTAEWYLWYLNLSFNRFLYILIHALLLTILLWMIIYRYTPYDEQGYLNYFKIKWAPQSENTDNNKNTIRTVVASFAIVTFIIIGFVCFLILYGHGYGTYPYLKSVIQPNFKSKYKILAALIAVFLPLIVTTPISIPILLYNFGLSDEIYKISASFDVIYVYLISLIPLCVVLIKRDVISIKIMTTLACFIASIFLVIYLMNIVMTFRNNTTPILKTKPLTWSLRNSLNNHLGYRITGNAAAKAAAKAAANAAADAKAIANAADATATDAAKTDTDDAVNKGITTAVTEGITTEYTKIYTCADSLGKNISSVLDIYIAFEELSKIVYNSLTIPAYTTKLKDTINKSKIYGESNETYNTPTLSLIFDKKVSIPRDYGDANSEDDPRFLNPEFSSSHEYNSNDRNTSYVYTADISYDNANLFYEKYWDMKDTDYEFLWRYDYALPVFLKKILLNGRPNLPRLFTSVGVFIVIVIIVVAIASIPSIRTNWNGFSNMKILAPFISLVVFVLYIIVFIWFNTHFNKNVVYKCLDCSYKRSLNKLNTVVSPYIRMYDNKITGGNKNYTHHYIIANVFYSILSGNINLLDSTIVSSVKVTAGGSGYTSAPIVVFTPSLGGVSATAFLGTGVDADKVVSINVTNGGSYTIVPNITFTPTNGGSGAVASAYIDSISINNNDDIDYNLYNSMSKLADMNMNILTNENDYREYYKTKFKDLYNTKNKDDIDKIYNVFTCVFGYVGGSIITADGIDTYFKTNIIKKSLISKIYLIIKRCIQLFEEELKNKNKPEFLKYFKFYKNKGELIPHKFILILKTKTDYDAFIKGVTSDFENILENKLNIVKESKDMTSILNDITDEDSTNQNKDIQSKCIIKIIAKYLLIMGHINYNRIDYITTSSLNKFSIDTLGLYKLISNVSYADTFVIDDTFGKDSKNINLLTAHPNYSKLTYMYNYLDTKYVILSSNKNNNYLLNIIKSINNTLNNDNKTTIANDIKEARYLFRDRINDTAPEKSYENEDAILMKADMISTTYFELTYFVNMLILLLYITGTIFSKIK